MSATMWLTCHIWEGVGAEAIAVTSSGGGGPSRLFQFLQNGLATVRNGRLRNLPVYLPTMCLRVTLGSCRPAMLSIAKHGVSSRTHHTPSML